jgi:acyl-CoA thioesterase-1
MKSFECAERGNGTRWQRAYWLTPAAAWAAARSLSFAPSFALALAWIALVAGGCGQDSDPASAASAQASASGQPSSPLQRSVIVFLGTSLTAGYGLPADQAYPALIQQRIRNAGLDYRIVNAGVSGDTSAGGLRRLDWLLRLPVSVLVLELGSNEMLRGLDIDALRKNLDAILSRTRDAHPGVRFVVAGMRAAPNLGPAYVSSFEAVYPALAADFDATLIPFLLEGVAGDPALNLADGIHPNVEGHRKIAASIWPVIEPVLAR